jgi:hypothetical protein
VGGTVQDLTNWEALFTFTADPTPTSDSDAAIQLDDINIGPTGIAEFQATETQTAPLVAGTTYYWVVKLRDPTGTFFTTIISGTAAINQSYFQRTT